MEIIINGATHTLKSVNPERRGFFVQKVLPHYNYKAKDFDKYIEEIQRNLEEKHGSKWTIKQITANFFKQYSKDVHKSLWSFLSSEDKKSLKKIENLDVSIDEIKKFIEYVSEKIRIYSNYMKQKHDDGVREDVHSVYSYLSRTYGWTLEEIKEMDELELMKAIENAVTINERENATNINSQALAGAYVGGNKQAKTQIDTINRKVTSKERLKQVKKANPEMKSPLSREELTNIMNRRKNGG